MPRSLEASLSHATSLESLPTRAEVPLALAVPPREASRLLSIGESTLYALLRAGELQSFRIGNARRISTQSIADYITRQLAARGGNIIPPNMPAQPSQPAINSNAA
jgi:excisionase family DNA binding protein